MGGIAVALVVAVIAGGVVLWAGRRWEVYDLPDDELKTHTGTPVPLGGVAVFAGIHAGLAAADVFNAALLVATLFMLVVGVIDDRRSLPPLVRLAMTAVAGVLLAGIGFPHLGLWGGLVGVALVVASVNAINLLDGLDALAGSVTAAVFAGLAVLGFVSGSDLWWVALIPAAATLGFVGWNLPPARLYLGDGGAYVLGVTIAWGILRAGDGWGGGLAAVTLIGVPFLDLGATVLRRWRTGAPLFGGDRQHSYDRLHDRGWPVGKVSAAFAVTQLLWVAVIVSLVWFVGPWWATAIGVGVAIGVVLAVASDTM